MDIPINVDVRCADGTCGRSTYIVIDPATWQVTHVVVREQRFPHTEYLVPVDWVVEATPSSIRLRCTAHQLVEAEPFMETEYVPIEMPPYAGSETLWPYRLLPLQHEQIPLGELALQPGAGVEATDGRVGRVDELLVEPITGQITHLVLREGHLWGQKNVTIPVAQIDRIEEDTVYLKLDKQALAKLPAIPVRLLHSSTPHAE
jgi:sporulation protein YlmC with PRC-barrel domain